MIEPLRVSLYNGITVEETNTLVEAMKNFEKIIMN